MAMRAAESGGKKLLPNAQVRAEPLPCRLYAVRRVWKSHQVKKKRREEKKRNKQSAQARARREQRAQERAAKQASVQARKREKRERRSFRITLLDVRRPRRPHNPRLCRQRRRRRSGSRAARAAYTPTAASASASQGKPPSLVRRSSSNSICRGSTTGLAITAGLVAGSGYMSVSLGWSVGLHLDRTQETL